MSDVIPLHVHIDALVPAEAASWIYHSDKFVAVDFSGGQFFLSDFLFNSSRDRFILVLVGTEYFVPCNILSRYIDAGQEELIGLFGFNLCYGAVVMPFWHIDLATFLLLFPTNGYRFW